MSALRNSLAFPQSETARGNTVSAEHGEGGMTYRQWLIGQIATGALADLRTSDTAVGSGEQQNVRFEEGIRTGAEAVVIMADAIIAELEKS